MSDLVAMIFETGRATWSAARNVASRSPGEHDPSSSRKRIGHRTRGPYGVCDRCARIDATLMHPSHAKLRYQNPPSGKVGPR